MNPMSKARGSLAGAVALLTVAVGWSLAVAQSSSDRADEASKTSQQANTRSETLEDRVAANEQALKQANSRLIALGKAPEPVPAQPAATPVPAGLTASQLEAVRAVVVDVLASTNAKVSQATINQISRAAGKLASDNLQVGLPAVVRAAVDAACAHDRCRGERGSRGERGLKGDNAPAVTDEQLLTAATAALVTYCGAESKPCQGPKGVGVREITCRDSDLMWVFTMTDDTTQLVRGPCRVVDSN